MVRVVLKMLLVHTIVDDNFELLEYYHSGLQVLGMVGWYAMVYHVAFEQVRRVKHYGVWLGMLVVPSEGLHLMLWL